jgi:hypothetical protein
MGRYFFHSRDGETYLDPKGVELPDETAARHEAARYLAGLLDDAPGAFWRSGKLEVIVADAAGVELFVLALTGTPRPEARSPG